MLLAAGLAVAQNAAITTERGEATMSTEVIGPGGLQVELGGLLERGQASVPMPLMRAGLSSRLELRAGGGGFPVELKYKLLGERRHRPGLAVASSFPTGSFDPALKLAWGKDVAHGFRAAGSFSKSRTSHGASVVVERALARRMTAYVEHSRGYAQRVWSAGLFRAIGRNMQLDLGAGRETACTRTPWRITASWAVRLRPPAR